MFKKSKIMGQLLKVNAEIVGIVEQDTQRRNI